MSSETILPVYLRLKPTPAQADGLPFVQCVPESSSQVLVEPPKNNRYKTDEMFSFTSVYRGGSTQLDVYKGTMYPLVENVLLNGRDSLFFTMGTSGAGKSHTTLGYKQTPGMIHLAIDTFFKSIGDKVAEFEDAEEISDKNPGRQSLAVEAGLFLDWSKTGNKPKFSANSMFKEKIEVSEKYEYAVYISMIEIYNEKIINLLDDGKKSTLSIKKDADSGKVFLANTQKIYVSEKEEAYRVIDLGLAKRQANSTGMNRASSRSHAFTVIEVKQLSTGRRKDVVKSSTLTIVDLAGSERNNIAKTAGKALTESCAINRSLMMLGQCLQQQRDREKTKEGKDFSNFRNSKLTQLLLSNVFVNKLHQKTVLMVNVDPYGDYNSTAQMLRYSALARDIHVPPSARVPSLSEESTGDSSVTLAELESRQVSGVADMGIYKGLVQRIHQLEQELFEANERVQTVEMEVREELGNEMEEMMANMQSQYLNHMDDDYERNQDLVDSKIELTNSIKDEIVDSLRRQLAEQVAENDRLTAMLTKAQFPSIKHGQKVRA